MDQTVLLEKVHAWPIEDQLNFVFRVWDQLVDSGWKPELTEELRAELDRRLDAHEADPNNVRSWEQLVDRVKGSR